MSLRRVQPQPSHQPAAGRLVAVLATGCKTGVPAQIGANYMRMPTPSGTEYVNVTATGDEIVDVMKDALNVIRNDASNMSFVQSTAIDVSSNDDDVKFAIEILFEQRGEKVLIRGNVGGAFKEHKLTSSQRVSNDWIARAIAGLFMVAGGNAKDIVKISYRKEA